MVIKQNMHLNLNGKGKKVNKYTLINIRRKTMTFINELLENQTPAWSRYAETIAMEDICEECEICFPKENNEQSNYKKGA